MASSSSAHRTAPHRTAPRTALPPELAQSLAWNNPYRFIEPSVDEKLALQGKLPRVRRRWLVAGLFGTLLHGGLLLMMSYGILSTLSEK
ncbi:MAG: hypothetical protein H0U56_08745 [Methylibium sp.]|uniref:hypothetical protein n=1 Tax=Methylibium sp. TaxID=2067992 RepID=UPI0018333310|nr:hypothetical protein [Methylibium sp.]MBA2722969.1 hypothetical protein [Methylibium sp.]